jgi:hypothetical protein
MKASEERSPASNASRSSFESVRYEDRRFHEHYRISLHTTCLGYALGAKEGDEFVRLLWREELGGLDPSGLVFVDEMGTHTSLAPH